MKCGKNKIKIYLLIDLLMAIIFVILFDKSYMPMKMHEIAGLVMLGVAALHFVIHPNYLIKITKLIFSKNSNLPIKTKVSYLLNLLLLISLVAMIISSFLISKVLFGNRGTFFMRDFHKTIAAVMLIIVGIHIGLHYKLIARKLKMNKLISTLLIVLSMSFGLFSIVDSDFIPYLLGSFSSSNVSQQYKGTGKGNKNHSVDFNGVGYTLISYGSIVYVFCFGTYQIEKLCKRKNKKARYKK